MEHFPVHRYYAITFEDYGVSNDKSLLIGFGAANYFNGSMCEVRMYDCALSDAEIKALSQIY